MNAFKLTVGSKSKFLVINGRWGNIIRKCRIHSSFKRVIAVASLIVALTDGSMGLPRGLSGKEFACQCRRLRRLGFDPWVGKIPWSRKWQPAPVFLPGKFLEQR